MKNQSAPVRLLQITDTHCYADDNARLEWSALKLYPNQSLSKILAHLADKHKEFDALVISGDLVQEETAAAYQRVQSLLSGFPLPVYVLPGNHDIPVLMVEYLVAQDANIHFQLHSQWANWHCLFLNTNQPGEPDGHLSDIEFADITAQLDLLSEDHNALIFMHHHPVAIGSMWMDRMGLQQASRFWSLLATYPQVKTVVFGHIHSEFRVQQAVGKNEEKPRYIEVLGTPATCVQVKHRADKEELQLDHALPAWRELTLYEDGQVDTSVHYLG